MINNELVKELVSGLNSIFGDKLDSIILYGSVVRGDNISESDVDIALIVKSDLSSEMKEVFFHWNAEFDIKYNMVFSIIDIRKDVIDKWGGVVPFYKNIRDEGVVLWKAA